LVSIATSTPSSAGIVLRGDGLSFPDPFLGLGESLELVGAFDPENSEPASWFLPGREYTWVVYGPVVYEVDEPAPGIRYMDLTFGVLEIREDSRLNAQFDADPPNASVPSTFRDGTVLLMGSVTDLRIRDIFGIVTATGEIRFEGGVNLLLLGDAVEWSFNAGVSLFGTEVPSGYSAHWAIETMPIAPVGVEAESWSRIKSLYR
jgi:hypothetical protein